jgi:phage shock protein A
MKHMASSEIEKKSLEAHVELCAERYKNLDDRLQNLDCRMEKIEELISEFKSEVKAVLTASAKPAETAESSNKVIITIGTAIIAALIGGIFTLIVHIK